MATGAQRRLVGKCASVTELCQMTLVILCMYQPQSSSQKEIEKWEHGGGGNLMFPNVAIPNGLGSSSKLYIFECCYIVRDKINYTYTSFSVEALFFILVPIFAHHDFPGRLGFTLFSLSVAHIITQGLYSDIFWYIPGIHFLGKKNVKFSWFRQGKV